MPKPTPIDLNDQNNWEKPLFVVYGPDSFPTMFCCKICVRPTYPNGKPCIWGFSVWRRVPGFRTLGVELEGWLDAHPNARFYLTQDEAFEDLKGLFSKVGGQPKPKVRKGHPLILTDEEWETLRSQLPAFRQQVAAQRVFARDKVPEYAAKHRKAARGYSRLIKAIEEQDPHD